MTKPNDSFTKKFEDYNKLKSSDFETKKKFLSRYAPSVICKYCQCPEEICDCNSPLWRDGK